MESIFFYSAAVAAALLLPTYINYRRSDYKNASGNGFLNTLFNTGNYGEFLTFARLEKPPGHHRLLTNLYIPKSSGATTEIDLVMISETGIYVFESKNYSGWIFGSEKDKYWTQTLPKGHKNRFYNPIWQNRAHINALANVLPDLDKSVFKSYIVFSRRCQLKKVTVTSPEVTVLRRPQLARAVRKDIASSKTVFSVDEVDRIYTVLSQFTLADQDVKKAHIQNIAKHN